MANNLAATCVNGPGIVTFKVSWQAGGWVGEYHGGRGTNASMTYYVAEHVMVNPLQVTDNVGETRGRKRETQGLREHATRRRCVCTRMGFCAADNLNASNSNSLTKGLRTHVQYIHMNFLLCFGVRNKPDIYGHTFRYTLSFEIFISIGFNLHSIW